MNDFLRESFSYLEIFKEIKKIDKEIEPEKIAYGSDKNQYYYHYEPEKLLSDKIIVWIMSAARLSVFRLLDWLQPRQL